MNTRQIGRAVVRHRAGVTCPRIRRMASSNAPIAAIKSLDHIVLTVKDIEATKTFYSKILGMKAETFPSKDGPRNALSFGSQKINLHESGAEFEPKAGRVQPGSADVCFLTDTPVEQVLEGLKKADIEVLEGGKVVDRTGAVGKLRSVYFRDPDDNLIEVSNYV